MANDFENMPPINDEQKPIPEAEDPNIIGEKKGTTFEEYVLPEDETLLQKLINKLQSKKKEREKKERHEAFLKTPEGIAWQENEKERIAADKRAAKIAEAVYAERVLHAKRKLALTLYADELIKKYRIQDDDPRLPEIIRELDEIRMVVSAAHYAK